ncbi:radical SAM protein [Novosphingobium sp. BL-8H]|uniref:radical SAM protein n=1 Tax=Novosphingobium sp. BL-8H TaxID=3127640 RepID=UPI00375820FF
MTVQDETITADAASLVDGAVAATQACDLMLNMLDGGLDHPELWPLIPSLVSENPLIADELRGREARETHHTIRIRLQVLLALCLEDAEATLAVLRPLTIHHSQNVQVQGAAFHAEARIDPENPKFALNGKVCLVPFTQLDVLENTTHLCCASWLPTSAGNLTYAPSETVWNGQRAQAIRESVLDGSYRHCNKRACPVIQSNDLKKTEDLVAQPKWHDILTSRQTAMPRGPETVNLAYDRTCNLSCPSCRTARYAADDATRARYQDMQDNRILPLLKNARYVHITGSGDPFASKNFRRLMEQLDADDYPDLKFIVMTNGMLFTPQQWAAFPSLHGRVASLRISLDAATGPTHELLRRGAKWSVMQENLKFAGELRAAGLVSHFTIPFTVQAENYREMGDAVDLAHEIGADHVFFARMTNWGTFSAEEYARKAVFVPGHPEYDDFVQSCRDPRLRDPIVQPCDLSEFFHA